MDMAALPYVQHKICWMVTATHNNMTSVWRGNQHQITHKNRTRERSHTVDSGERVKFLSNAKMKSKKRRIVNT